MKLYVFRMRLACLALCMAVVCLPSGVALAEKFKSGGKRDPFITLIQERQSQQRAQFDEPPPITQRPPGLSGLLISEVTVAGTAGSQDKMLVILKGIDESSYIAAKDAKLFDGYLESITSEQVVFIREREDRKGTTHRSKVVKRVYVEEVGGDYE